MIRWIVHRNCLVFFFVEWGIKGLSNKKQSRKLMNFSIPNYHPQYDSRETIVDFPHFWVRYTRISRLTIDRWIRSLPQTSFRWWMSIPGGNGNWEIHLTHRWMKNNPLCLNEKIYFIKMVPYVGNFHHRFLYKNNT